MLVCKRVTYSGWVQGVGFRATAHHLAHGFAVSGHVRNLADGTVELVAEGQTEAVDAFLAALDQAMGRHVTDRAVVLLIPENRQGFHIRY
jgi:acylphosphatase